MANQYKDELITIINRFLPNARITLFGSRARKTHSSGADIDLALDTGKAIGLNTILDIKSAIEESTIPLFVDLVDENSAPSSLKKEINKDGIRWN